MTLQLLHTHSTKRESLDRLSHRLEQEEKERETIDPDDVERRERERKRGVEERV